MSKRLYDGCGLGELVLRARRALDVQQQCDVAERNEVMELCLHAVAEMETPTIGTCAACKSPFEVKKRGTIYCSHKCADRIGTRNRRARQKAENEKDANS